MKLEGNTILITGGSGGIGFELASQLLRRGNTVIITGRNESALTTARGKLPGVHAVCSDVSDPQAIARLFDQVVTAHPRLNVLINNAGVMQKINLQTFGTDLDAIVEEININLSGPIRMVMQFLPHLRQQEHPAIVNVSSGLAFSPFPIAPIYGSTKAGLHSFTQSLRVQLKHTNIRVFELAPPAVDTPMNHKFSEELKGAPLLASTKLVEQALKGLENDRAEIRVGFANVLKLMSRVAPEFMLKQLSKPVEQMLAQMKQMNR